MTSDVNLIDTHAHLADKAFAGDLDDALDRAQAAGVSRVIAVGDGVAESRRCLDLARGRPGRVFATAGVHPHHASQWDADAEAALVDLLDADEVVAVGEIGLDYHYDFSPRDAQREAFRRQMDLARERDLPVVIHCRDAAEDLFADLDAHPPGAAGGEIHCFTGTEREAREALERGFHLGAGGILTFKKSEPLREAFDQVPLDRLLLETDAPYLAPVPRRGKRNEPAYTRHTAEYLAERRGVALAALAAATTDNARRLFRLP